MSQLSWSMSSSIDGYCFCVNVVNAQTTMRNFRTCVFWKPTAGNSGNIVDDSQRDEVHVMCPDARLKRSLTFLLSPHEVNSLIVQLPSSQRRSSHTSGFAFVAYWNQDNWTPSQIESSHTYTFVAQNVFSTYLILITESNQSVLQAVSFRFVVSNLSPRRKHRNIKSMQSRIL